MNSRLCANKKSCLTFLSPKLVEDKKQTKDLCKLKSKILIPKLSADQNATKKQGLCRVFLTFSRNCLTFDILHLIIWGAKDNLGGQINEFTHKIH